MESMPRTLPTWVLSISRDRPCQPVSVLDHPHQKTPKNSLVSPRVKLKRVKCGLRFWLMWLCAVCIAYLGFALWRPNWKWQSHTSVADVNAWNLAPWDTGFDLPLAFQASHIPYSPTFLASTGPVSQMAPLQQREIVPISSHLNRGPVVLWGYNKSACGGGCLWALPKPFMLPRKNFLLHSFLFPLSCSWEFTGTCDKGMVSGAWLQRVALVKYLHFNPHVCSS